MLLALNATSGAVLWRFNTLVGPNPGVRALGLGAGGAWETPLVSGDGSVTYGIGNPYQTAAAAIAHPAANLYTDSDVNLDAATGKLRWYYQGVPDDFKDWDMQASPISARSRWRFRRDRQRQDGRCLRDERHHRQADLEDPGGRAQRP